MARMGIEALYRRPNTTQQAPGHKVYPYLLRGLTIERANQVWARTSPTSRWPRLRLPGARSWTGPAAECSSHRVSITHGHRLLRRGARGGARAVRAARDLQHRPGQPVHQRRVHRRARRPTASASAWTARGPGATTSSSSGCGDREVRRGLSARLRLGRAKPRRASRATSSSTTRAVLIRRWTGRRPMSSTSPRCRRSGRQPER